MIEISQKTVDIPSILESKLGSRIKYVPKFLIRWLTTITHQDEVNEFLWETREIKGVEWLEECVKYLDMTLHIEGMENLPSKDDGRSYTFVSNHPLGGVDGVALGAIIGRHYDGGFRYIVNDLLMNLPGLAPVCIPVNKTGKQSRNLPLVIKEGFASPYHMLMFPAGLCSRRTNGVIKDLEWSKTFIQKSVETHRDVVPIHFDGSNSLKFYRIANICKALHLKVNIAMLFLVDEMYKNRHESFRVTIGKPIPWQTFDKSRSPKEWAQWVKEKVYEQAAEKDKVN